MPKRIKKRKAALEGVVKQEAFEAVMDILKTHDPKDLTLEMVADRVGMATSTLYNYFQNRANLIAYVIVRLFEPTQQEFFAIAASDLPVCDKLHRTAELYVRAHDQQNALIVLLNDATSVAATTMIKEIQQARETSTAHMLEIMEDGMRQKVLRNTKPMHLMLSFAGITQAFLGYRTMCKSKAPAKEEADNIMEVFMNGAKETA